MNLENALKMDIKIWCLGCSTPTDPRDLFGGLCIICIHEGIQPITDAPLRQVSVSTLMKKYEQNS
jgi:hypothetical protein